METARPGMGRAFFDAWFQAIHVDHKLPRVHDKKLTILALCALMELPPSAIPETLKAGWSGILAGILRIFTDLPRAIQGNTHTPLFITPERSRLRSSERPRRKSG